MQMFAEAAKQEHLGGSVKNWQGSNWQCNGPNIKEEKKRKQLVKSVDKTSHPVTSQNPVLQRREASSNIDGEERSKPTCYGLTVINSKRKENAPEKTVRSDMRGWDS